MTTRRLSPGDDAVRVRADPDGANAGLIGARYLVCSVFEGWGYLIDDVATVRLLDVDGHPGPGPVHRVWASVLAPARQTCGRP